MDLRNLIEHIRRFDAYPKTMEDFRIKTFCGATVTVISGVIMIALLFSELNYFLTTEITEELFVDTGRGEKLRINADIILHRVSCNFLSIDAIDVSGAQQINVEHNIYKRRLDLSGKPITDPEREEKLGTPTEPVVETTAVPEIKCGSCYGAETPHRNCCNTCEEVHEAYRHKGWVVSNLNDIAQCRLEGWAQNLKHQDNESCQVFGYLEVNRVAGNFHVAPGRSLQQHHAHVHDLLPYKASEFNLTHTIRHLSFGVKIPGKGNPLDGTFTLAEEGAMMYQYYVKIVPTTYKRLDGMTLSTNQFSVTRHQKSVKTALGEQGLPGVFIIYELSPLMVKYTETQRSFTHFLTGVCAIIGGIFTVAGLIDAMIYHSSRVIQKKMELGKLS